MNYKMTVKIYNPTIPSKEKDFELDCTFVCNENDYGNGFYVGIKGKEFYPQYIDLRYDRHFDRTHKAEWLRQWAHNYWSGEDGSYKVKELQIEKVI